MPLRSGPALARILPFVVYILFLAGEASLKSLIDVRWLYAAQVIVVGGLLAYFWSDYDELRRPSPVRAAHWLLGVVVGIAVFVLWINLDFSWAQLGEGRGVAADLTAGTAIAGLAVRVLGVVVLVPIMEELFWRSFLARWFDKSDLRSRHRRSAGARSCSPRRSRPEHHLCSRIVAGIAFAWLHRVGIPWAWPMTTNALLSSGHGLELAASLSEISRLRPLARRTALDRGHTTSGSKEVILSYNLLFYHNAPSLCPPLLCDGGPSTRGGPRPSGSAAYDDNASPGTTSSVPDRCQTVRAAPGSAMPMRAAAMPQPAPRLCSGERLSLSDYSYLNWYIDFNGTWLWEAGNR
jgi:CAAX prenyl protease-like protein